jgi:hypothetical protein
LKMHNKNGLQNWACKWDLICHVSLLCPQM